MIHTLFFSSPIIRRVHSVTKNCYRNHLTLKNGISFVCIIIHTRYVIIDRYKHLIDPCLPSGFITIDMFCDHYVFIAPSMTSSQIETCTLFNRNITEQPWYMVLIATIPTIVATIVMFTRIKRSIYDMMSFLLYFVIGNLLAVRISSIRTNLAKTTQTDQTIREHHLQQLAYAHATAAVLLFVLILLQIVAEKKSQQPMKNKMP